MLVENQLVTIFHPYLLRDAVTDYYYQAIPGMLAARANIVGDIAVHGRRVYFIHMDRPGDPCWLYYMDDLVGSWSLVNVAVAAGPLLGQVPAGDHTDYRVAVSDDGKTIGYFGNTTSYPGVATFCYYTTPDGAHFSFHKADDAQLTDHGSLQFARGCFYYISRQDSSVHQLAWQESYCENPALSEYPA